MAQEKRSNLLNAFEKFMDLMGARFEIFKWIFLKFGPSLIKLPTLHLNNSI